MNTFAARRRDPDGGLGISCAISRIFQDLRDELDTVGRGERILILFWLAGPFVYLIESAPADIWLGTVGLAFLVRSAVCRDWSWMSAGWVRAVSIFVIACLLSSALSDAPLHAAGKTAAWVRFPLYAAATAFWLASTPARQRAMLTVSAIGALVLCGILVVEMIAEPGKVRLYGLYGDPKAGGYLAKLAMPVVTVLAIIAIRVPLRRGLLIVLLPIAFILFTICTGERVHAALVVLAVCLATISTGFGLRRMATFAAVGIMALAVLANLNPVITDRFVGETRSTVHDFFGSPYWGAMRQGLVGFMERPMTGIGVHLHRSVCPDLPEKRDLLPGTAQCLSTHAHQHYVQLAEETGILGLVAGIGMFLAIIRTCWRARRIAPWEPNQSLRGAAWITPVVMFLPQINPDFFGQWNNLFVWFALGLALAMSRDFQERTSRSREPKESGR